MVPLLLVDCYASITGDGRHPEHQPEGWPV